MPTIIPPGFGIVAHEYEYDGTAGASGPSIVTYAVNVGIGGGQAVLDTCVEYWGSVAEGINSADVSVYRSTLKVGPNATGATFENATILAGAETGASVPPQVAGLVRKSTGLGGRANRGRFYMPHLSQSVVDARGTIGSVALGDYNTVLATWLSGLEGEGINVFILHSDPGASDPTEVTAVSMQPLVATQRRRVR